MFSTRAPSIDASMSSRTLSLQACSLYSSTISEEGTESYSDCDDDACVPPSVSDSRQRVPRSMTAGMDAADTAAGMGMVSSYRTDGPGSPNYTWTPTGRRRSWKSSVMGSIGSAKSLRSGASSISIPEEPLTLASPRLSNASTAGRTPSRAGSSRLSFSSSVSRPRKETTLDDIRKSTAGDNNAKPFRLSWPLRWRRKETPWTLEATSVAPDELVVLLANWGIVIRDEASQIHPDVMSDGRCVRLKRVELEHMDPALSEALAENERPEDRRLSTSVQIELGLLLHNRGIIYRMNPV